MKYRYAIKPLDGSFERVRRAEEHLADLKGRIDAAILNQINALSIVHDINPPHDVRITLPIETFWDMRPAILLGEICYNLRAALDYLVFELARLDSGSEQKGTQFPIENTRVGFEGRAKGAYLKGVNAAHIAAIERLQPYNGCDWTRRLRECSNPDKHRHFMPTGGRGTYTVHSSLQKDITRCLGHERETPHPIPGQPPVKVKVYVSMQISFPDGALVIETIEKLKAEIANVLEAFKPEF